MKTGTKPERVSTNRDEIAKAFEMWDKEWKENPDEFEEITGKKEDYESQADKLMECLNKIKDKSNVVT